MLDGDESEKTVIKGKNSIKGTPTPKVMESMNEWFA